MPQKDEGACEMKHAEKIIEPMFPAHGKTAKVLKPGEEPFDLPPTAVAAQGTSILRTIPSVASMWSNHLYSGFSQFPVQPVRIVRVVTDETLNRLGDKDLSKCVLDESHLVRRC